MNLKQRLAEIKAELRNLQNSIPTAKDEELDEIQEKMTSLETELRSVQKKIQMEAKAKRSAMSIPDDGLDDEPDEDDESGEDDQQERSVITALASSGDSKKSRAKIDLIAKRKQMGEDLIQSRTVILDSTVLVPKKQSDTLTPFPFNQVSSVIGAVKYTPIINGETYESPYVISNGEADYTEQPNASGAGGKYHTVGIQWDKATISKTKITAYGEITKELERTPVAKYADAVEQNVTISLRKKIAKEIVMGDGETGHFVGIMSDSLKNKNTVADFKLGAINENTLDEIVLNYGGEEDIESAMSLLMNKLTLLAFAKVRGADKKKVYTINYTNGTIDGIKFFTSSNVVPFQKAKAGTDTESATTTRGDVFLAYGDFNQYEVAIFSNIETAKSTDFKFDQGITCYRGDAYLGGNVVGYKAFMRVYRASATVKELTAIESGK